MPRKDPQAYREYMRGKMREYRAAGRRKTRCGINSIGGPVNPNMSSDVRYVADYDRPGMDCE